MLMRLTLSSVSEHLTKRLAGMGAQAPPTVGLPTQLGNQESVEPHFEIDPITLASESDATVSATTHSLPGVRPQPVRHKITESTTVAGRLRRLRV